MSTTDTVDLDQIRKVTTRYEEVLARQNADMMGEFYAPEATMEVPDDDPVVGREAIIEAWRHRFEEVGVTGIKVTVNGVEPHAESGGYSGTGTFRITVQPKENVIVERDGAFQMFWVLKDGITLIVREVLAYVVDTNAAGASEGEK